MSAFQLPNISPDCRKDLIASIHAMPASKWLGLRVLGFDLEGISVIELPVKPELTFDGRVVQGGIVGTLADYAGVSAAACTLEPGWIASTTGFEVHNLAPAAGARLIAVGRNMQRGSTHAVSTAEVWAQADVNNDTSYRLVCIATTTCKPFQIK
ncbi:PaaI family thioesterase [Variovorax sp. PCZ-1]|uniref:PaaI family thioesterase n=1 Tax=Variovorax sp. PCZ-1 TaxID=2835533 RepID=UPI001BCE9168|nr:PaaI family thioesterase [Variovorax sp. PCZ-1]MBS7806272.1 PaaI family thioesterase [Variovorax sp. PCZ-1]